MQTQITEILGIDYPIFQGAMAWISDEDLASAVSNAGGLGIIGTGNDTADQVKEKVERMFTLTDKPFAVNVMLLNPHADAVMEYLVTSGVKIITTGAGNPGKYMDQIQEAGIHLIPVVSSVALAKRMERIGATAIVVEGMEAGGHIGKQTTLPLVPQVVDAVSIPVIAAGGIADGRGVAAVLMLGAQGVQLGTLFSVAKESNAHPDFKQAVIKANDIATVVTGSISGHPVRVLRNQLTKEFLRVEKEITSQDQPDLARLDALGKDSLRRAVVEGDVKQGSVMAGQIAGLVNEEQSCEAIIQQLMHEAKETYQAKAKLFQ
ncbi:nitronate monooxygenase [Aerococcaceae bacterium DSM 111020]|nr:nitronate monooxygenase [Aerococcaceae bacterium DSM 111020]